MGQRGDYRKGLHTLSDIPVNEKKQNTIGPHDTVYRYLCPLRKIGIGGDIARQLRAQTHARIRINQTIPGCDERVVTIYSPSEETNMYDDGPVCAAQDALFRVHDRVVAEVSPPMNGSFEETDQFGVRLLVPSDQIGCVIGKGGELIKGIRNDTHAQVRILGSGHLPPCALSSDELIRMLEAPSRRMDAMVRLQPRCSEKVKRDIGEPIITTRLLVPSQKFGCIIGKGGAIIEEIRSISKANVRIYADENVPKVASEDDEMVQRLRTSTFETGGSPPDFPNDAFSGHKYVNRDHRMRNSGYSAYSGDHGSKNLPPTKSYDESQIVSGSGYRAYGVYSSGRHSTGSGYGA